MPYGLGRKHVIFPSSPVISTCRNRTSKSSCWSIPEEACVSCPEGGRGGQVLWVCVRKELIGADGQGTFLEREARGIYRTWVYSWEEQFLGIVGKEPFLNILTNLEPSPLVPPFIGH